MGGKALSQPSPRLATPRLLQLVEDLQGRLKTFNPSLQIRPIPWYTQKPDHGDLDLLVAATDDFDPSMVAKAIDAVEVVRNNTVTSLGIEQPEGVFQVDLIAVDPQAFDFALSYFAYNDMGNLLGRVAHKLGFKLGHLGLSYVLRDPENDTRVIDELVVTTSWSEALNFLGYDAKAYRAAVARGGFDTLEEIFEYVVSNPYVNRDIYLLDNRNQKARARDSKRKTYSDFLEWIEAADARGEVPRFNWEHKAQVRSQALDRAKGVFPSFGAAFEVALHRESQHRAARRRFNGEVVSTLTGLRGFELGAVMKEFRSRFDGEESMVAWILASNTLQIEARIFECQARVICGVPSMAEGVTNLTRARRATP